MRAISKMIKLKESQQKNSMQGVKMFEAENLKLKMRVRGLGL